MATEHEQTLGDRLIQELTMWDRVCFALSRLLRGRTIFGHLSDAGLESDG